MAKMTGQCLCGAVTVTATPERPSLAACHCNMCRRWTSAAFVAFPSDDAVAEGPVKVFQSSEWAERAFCERCGSALWYRITAPGPGHGQYQLASGLFDVAGMHLGLEVFIDEKPDAYAFDGAENRRQMTGAEIIAIFAPKEDGA